MNNHTCLRISVITWAAIDSWTGLGPRDWLILGAILAQRCIQPTSDIHRPWLGENQQGQIGKATATAHATPLKFQDFSDRAHRAKHLEDVIEPLEHTHTRTF